MVDFDRIITSVPANATAGRVMSRGEHWEPEGPMPPGLQHWKSPPPLRRFVKTESNIDLTGKAWGRFTVVGLAAESANDGARWIVRCVCGDYEARSAKTIKSALAGLSADNTLSFQCYYCYSWKAVQARYKKKGAKPIAAFVNPAARVLRHQTPEAIIAELAGDYETAVKIVAKLNKSGFRIVRGDKSGIATPQSPADKTPIENKGAGQS